jgi:hypothetical protein
MLSFSSMGSPHSSFLTINTIIDFILLLARLTVERPTLLSLHTHQFRWRTSSDTVHHNLGFTEAVDRYTCVKVWWPRFRSSRSDAPDTNK